MLNTCFYAILQRLNFSYVNKVKPYLTIHLELVYHNLNFFHQWSWIQHTTKNTHWKVHALKHRYKVHPIDHSTQLYTQNAFIMLQVLSSSHLNWGSLTVKTITFAFLYFSNQSIWYIIQHLYMFAKFWINEQTKSFLDSSFSRSNKFLKEWKWKLKGNCESDFFEHISSY